MAQDYLQKEASKDVSKGQLITTSDRTPQPFSSSTVINNASMWSVLNLGQIPRLSAFNPTCSKVILSSVPKVTRTIFIPPHSSFQANLKHGLPFQPYIGRKSSLAGCKNDIRRQKGFQMYSCWKLVIASRSNHVQGIKSMYIKETWDQYYLFRKKQAQKQ